MSKAIVKPMPDMAAIERVLIRGDLAELLPEQRVTYYNKVCETLGLNPITRPFDYIELNRKLVLYANKGCAEQLRNIHKISIRIMARETIDGVYVVTAQASGKNGRVDESTGAVATAGLRGDVLANAYLKCETKAKRRVTLSICGLNMLDTSEVDSIPGARTIAPEPEPQFRPAVIAPKAALPAPVPEPEKPKTRTILWADCRALGLRMNYNNDTLKEWVQARHNKKVEDMTVEGLGQFLATLRLWSDCIDLGQKMSYDRDMLTGWVWDAYKKAVKDMTDQDLDGFLGTLHKELAGVEHVQ